MAPKTPVMQPTMIDPGITSSVGGSISYSPNFSTAEVTRSTYCPSIAA